MALQKREKIKTAHGNLPTPSRTGGAATGDNSGPQERGKATQEAIVDRMLDRPERTDAGGVRLAIEPRKGERGPLFTRTFKPAFINFLAGLSDKFTDFASNMQMRTAGQKYMKVEFLGAMLIKPVSGPRKAKSRRLLIEGAAYVPDMGPITLLSTKSLYRQQGIRTFLNDDCFFLLPNGEKIDFLETHFARWQHYMRYLVTMGYTVVHLVKTCDMHANTLTKVEHKSAFIVFRKLAMNLGGKY